MSRVWIAFAMAAMAAGCSQSTTEIDVTQLFAQISPGPGAIARCQTVQLSMSLVDQLSRPVAVDSVQWSSSDAASASVSSTGLVRALAVTPSVTISGVAFARGLFKTSLVNFSVSTTGAASGPCP